MNEIPPAEDPAVVHWRIRAALLAEQRSTRRLRRLLIAEWLLMTVTAAGLGNLASHLWQTQSREALLRIGVVLVGFFGLVVARISQR